jgi:hypothetical protein
VVQPAADTALYLFDDWFDPIEAGLCNRMREFIQAMVGASSMRYRGAGDTSALKIDERRLPTP